MSERINASDSRATIRWKLLTSASALALVSSINVATAEDTDRPLIWLELGGQVENVSGEGEVFAPPFLAANPHSPVLNSVTPLEAQRPAKFGFDEDGRISFQPESSDWVFSASVQYGRSSSSRKVHHQTYNVLVTKYNSGVPHPGNILFKHKFADTQAGREESRAILDFTAGKDVGLGMFGENSTSTVSLGVRIAQFTSKASVEMRALPDIQFKYATLGAFGHPEIEFRLPYFHTYHAIGEASRSFRGVGPMLSWSGSTPFVGNQQDGELTLDWGANAALLFGRQKAHARHQETAHYLSRYGILQNGGYYALTYQHPPAGHDTDRSVTVPNVGGSVGLSWRVQDFKVSFGYRADFFFGAMDAGIDARRSETLGFKGPYASISVGLGD
ncbi:MAG TPA: hypothetical protein VGT78_08820 [Rhizomicrobium sp.]|nr:hypothetical protein [Rhizomicrobium sp.]